MDIESYTTSIGEGNPIERSSVKKKSGNGNGYELNKSWLLFWRWLAISLLAAALTVNSCIVENYTADAKDDREKIKVEHNEFRKEIRDELRSMNDKLDVPIKATAVGEINDVQHTRDIEELKKDVKELERR